MHCFMFIVYNEEDSSTMLVISVASKVLISRLFQHDNIFNTYE